jgi:hypothetical protein
MLQSEITEALTEDGKASRQPAASRRDQNRLSCGAVELWFMWELCFSAEPEMCELASRRSMYQPAARDATKKF